MTRILIYSSEFLPFKGGVGRYTEDMAAMLGGAGKVEVLTETPNRGGYDDGAQGYSIARLALPLFARHPWLNLAINFISCAAVVLRARLGGWEWLVATGKRSVYNAAFFAPFLGRAKLAIVLHGSEWSDIEKAQGWRGRWLRRAFLRLSVASRAIIIPNRFTVDRFRSLPGFPAGRTWLLHPIVNPDRVRPDDALAEEYRRKFFEGAPFSVITVARLTPRKGQDMVIKALGRMAREGDGNFRYFIVGSGSYKPALEKLAAEEGVGGRAVFLDGLGDVEAYSLMGLCDLFAMPNREHKGTFEGFGIAFLEANVLGVPALAGKSGGSTEAVQDGANGIVCDGDDAEDVYRKIDRYRKDDALRARLKEGCRAHALEGFSFARWKSEYRSVFGDEAGAAPIA